MQARINLKLQLSVGKFALNFPFIQIGSLDDTTTDSHSLFHRLTSRLVYAQRERYPSVARNMLEHFRTCCRY